ncbi:hypothetical protein, partial [Acinetobacter baumannii]
AQTADATHAATAAAAVAAGSVAAPVSAASAVASNAFASAAHDVAAQDTNVPAAHKEHDAVPAYDDGAPIVLDAFMPAESSITQAPAGELRGPALDDATSHALPETGTDDRVVSHHADDEIRHVDDAPAAPAFEIAAA